MPKGEPQRLRFALLPDLLDLPARQPRPALDRGRAMPTITRRCRMAARRF